MNKIRSVALALLVSLPYSCLADESWQVTFFDTEPNEAIQLLGQMFELQLVNPQASCLKNTVSYKSDKSWSRSEAMELISQVARNAGCEAVIYEGDAFVVQNSIVGH